MDHQTMVEEIAEVADEVLSEWEIGFIEDMTGKAAFSEKQKAVIERIYGKVCDSPY